VLSLCLEHVEHWERNADHFYRVQVGPYGDIRSAKIVKSQGFESIIKHRGA
jgi:hypothetical protein